MNVSFFLSDSLCKLGWADSNQNCDNVGQSATGGRRWIQKKIAGWVDEGQAVLNYYKDI